MKMLRSDDVIWEPDNESAKKSTINKSGVKSKRSSQSGKKKVAKNGLANFDLSEIAARNNSTKENSSGVNGVTLKDLNPEDKQKIAQLIKELAKVGEEKENIVHALNDERQQFLSHVRQLEDEKNTLMNKQQFLSEEVKQCQTLLQYYQNLITMQQSSILAQEEAQKRNNFEETPQNQPKSRSFQNLDPGSTSIDEYSSQVGDVKVNEIYSGDTSTANSSITDDEVLRMSDRQYKGYLQRKKEKLKKEQESLRKLLSMKVQSDVESEEIEISPVRDRSDILSHSSKTTIEKRSVPVQTLTPVAPKQSSSYLSPSRSTSNETHHKSYASSRSSETLKRSTSSEKILHILTQDIANDDLQENTFALSTIRPLPEHTSNLSVSSSNARISTNVMNADDSQILQDIFFV